jgi:hypothetical protein
MYMAANLRHDCEYVADVKRGGYFLSRLVRGSPDSNYRQFVEVLIVRSWRGLVAIDVPKTEPNVRTISSHIRLSLRSWRQKGGRGDSSTRVRDFVFLGCHWRPANFGNPKVQQTQLASYEEKLKYYIKTSHLRAISYGKLATSNSIVSSTDNLKIFSKYVQKSQSIYIYSI